MASDLPQSSPPRDADFTVGDWLTEPSLNRISSGSTQLHMRPQLMDLLVCLARRRGRVVSKDELLAEVWPDRVITESGMVRCIAELRQLLGDDSREPRYIETHAKRGYRLVAEVTWHTSGPPAPGAATPSTTAPQPALTQSAVESSTPGATAADFESRPTPPAADTSRQRSWWRNGKIVAPLATGLALATAAAAFWVARPAPGPVLTETDTVVLAFENSTGDRVFDDTLPLALAIQLEQSPFLQILSSERVAQTLTAMKRPAETPITRLLGLEICERLGATALIVGSLTPLDTHYVIGLEAFGCASRESIGREQTEVESKQEVLGAFGRAASRLRRRLGESIASIQAFDVPITEATTSSLEALRALRQGDAAYQRGQNADALRLYREAVAIDPEFALAHSRLGGFAVALHYEPEGVAALEKAFALRDRVTVAERLEIDYAYHSTLTGDLVAITNALQEMRRTYPRRLPARRRLAAHYLNIGRFEEALSEGEQARALEPNGAPVFTVTARALVALGRFAEARTLLERAVTESVDNELHHSLLLQIGFLTADAALVARERSWAMARPEATPLVLEAEAEDAVWRGRLRESLEYLDGYQTWATQRGARHRWTVLELRKARYEALCGFSDRAVARTRRQLARSELGNDLRVDALKVAASAGDAQLMAQLLEDFERQAWPKGEEPYNGFVRSGRAALEIESGRPEAALGLLEPMIPYELGLLWGLIPLNERARALLQLKRWEEARDAYQLMLRSQGVVSGQKLLPAAQLGLARALRAGGLVEDSRKAYQDFLDLWKEADRDLPLLAEARRELARLR